ncbi:MAG TPA: NAD-dependent epimerase/dehydratase family protein [Terriglobales bacterium]|nr:NAD-dependent epimerase/dehydratase family protein [Terriglobales bacterium]
MAKKILITGGAGFVGSHLADRLLREGHEVRVFDNLTPQVHDRGVPEYLAGEVNLIIGDLRDPDAVRDAINDIDVIFHFGAAVGVGQSMYEIAHYMGTNAQGTANLLQAILDNGNKLEKLIVASSMSIYGEGRYLCVECGEVTPNERSQEQLRFKRWEPICPGCGRDLAPIPTDETKPLNVSSYYALSKKDQEEMVLLFGRTYGIPAVALRFFNIYGTRQALSNPYTGVAAIFASRLMNERPPLVFEDGNQMRDFVSVHDIVRANLMAMKHPEANGMALNIGSGEPISVREVASALATALGVGLEPELTGKFRAGDIRHCFADISRAKQVVGYEPKVKFQDGVRELVEWLKEQPAEDRAAEAVQKLTVFGLTA